MNPLATLIAPVLERLAQGKFNTQAMPDMQYGHPLVKDFGMSVPQNLFAPPNARITELQGKLQENAKKLDTANTKADNAQQKAIEEQLKDAQTEYQKQVKHQEDLDNKVNDALRALTEVQLHKRIEPKKLSTWQVLGPALIGLLANLDPSVRRTGLGNQLAGNMVGAQTQKYQQEADAQNQARQEQDAQQRQNQMIMLQALQQQATQAGQGVREAAGNMTELQKASVGAETRKDIAQIQADAKIKAKEMDLYGKPPALIKQLFDDKLIDSATYLEALSGNAPSETKRNEASAQASIARALLDDTKRMSWPAHMQNERDKVLLSLGMLQAHLDRFDLDSWFKANELGLRATEADNKAAEGSADLMDQSAEAVSKSAEARETSARNLAPAIAKAIGDKRGWNEKLQQNPNDPEANVGFQAAEAQYQSLMKQKKTLEEDAAKERERAKGLTDNAAKIRAGLKRYEVTAPPTRKTEPPVLGSAQGKAPPP